MQSQTESLCHTNMSILVFIEHKGGALNKTSLEAIAAAQKLATDLGQKVSAVVLGSSSLAQEIAAYDLEKVISAENGQLADLHSRCLCGGARTGDSQCEPAICDHVAYVSGPRFRPKGCGPIWQRFDWRLYSHER
jgi:hypothetical protein